MKDYIYRMMDERKYLFAKWDKLCAYMNKKCHDLNATERYLMGEQERIMLHYITILDARISHAILKE
jgi:hypothetical protein|nr:MAG TPA: hypothetical protein [Caudoviricetes sp.]